MRLSRQFRFALAAIGGMLLAGCVATSRPGSAAATGAADNDPAPVNEKVVSAHAHFALGMVYDAQDKPEAALEELSLAAKDDPSNEELVLELSGRYLQRKEPERALELLRLASGVPAASAAIFSRLSLVYLELHQEEPAMKAAEAAIQREPLLIDAYRNLVLIHLQKGRGAQASAVLGAAAKQADAPLPFLLQLAELYNLVEHEAPSQKESARTAAKAVLDRAAKRMSPDPRMQMRLADDFNLEGDDTNAIKYYLQALNRQGGQGANPEVRLKLAELYMRTHEPDKASEQVKAIVRDDPDNPQAYYFLGSLAYEAKKLPEAEDYYSQSLRLSDDERAVFFSLAEVQINLDHVEPALKTLERAKQKFGESYMEEFLTGLAYNRDKNFGEAVNHFSAAEALGRKSNPSPLTQYFYFEAGSAYERKGDYEQAEKSFEEALKLAPDFADAQNYLGYMLAEHGRKLDHARELIEKAVKSEPKNPAFLDSLAWVLYKLKQPAQALPQQLKAIELTEKPDATLYDHLGDIYQALHRQDKAREAWQKSLAVEPNDEIQKKLQSAVE